MSAERARGWSRLGRLQRRLPEPVAVQPRVQPALWPPAADTPPEWTLIGYFCVGYPSEEHDVPTLQREGWEQRRPPVMIRR
ncbi:hypothetical protein AJ88_27975 [Mesorhizobium amorphae CCBAU 01583]|nr:hypothetical protein AJ88_27975 [Mesorhizobium amorphae CCBAU 01583]